MSFLKLIWPFPLFLLSALYLCWFRLRRAGRIQRTPSPFPLSNREAHSSRGSSTVRLLIMSSVFFISDFVCVCIFLYCVFIVFALRDFFLCFVSAPPPPQLILSGISNLVPVTLFFALRTLRYVFIPRMDNTRTKVSRTSKDIDCETAKTHLQ